MKFFKVSCIGSRLGGGNEYLEAFHFRFQDAVDQLKGYSNAGHYDLMLEECLSFGPDLFIPDHDYDFHYATLYVVKAGFEDERVHYSFHVDHLSEILKQLHEDGAKNVNVNSTTISHSRNPKKPVAPAVTSLGQLLRSKLQTKWTERVLIDLRNGQMISAIKGIRTETDLGLKEAKEVADYVCLQRRYKIDYKSLNETQKNAVDDLFRDNGGQFVIQ